MSGHTLLRCDSKSNERASGFDYGFWRRVGRLGAKRRLLSSGIFHTAGGWFARDSPPLISNVRVGFLRELSIGPRRLLPSFQCSLLGVLPLSPFRSRPASKALDSFGSLQVAHQTTDHVATDSGTAPFEIGDAKVTGDRFNRMLHEFGLCTAW